MFLSYVLIYIALLAIVLIFNEACHKKHKKQEGYDNLWSDSSEFSEIFKKEHNSIEGYSTKKYSSIDRHEYFTKIYN